MIAEAAARRTRRRMFSMTNWSSTWRKFLVIGCWALDPSVRFLNIKINTGLFEVPTLFSEEERGMFRIEIPVEQQNRLLWCLSYAQVCTGDDRCYPRQIRYNHILPSLLAYVFATCSRYGSSYASRFRPHVSARLVPSSKGSSSDRIHSLSCLADLRPLIP